LALALELWGLGFSLVAALHTVQGLGCMVYIWFRALGV
jgi:hypothetical protein